jgi:hypothetical protein
MLTGVWVRIIIGLNEEIKHYKIMGHYEDLWYEISDSIKEKGLKKEFNAQLEKMNHQDKHKYKESKERWEYAHRKVIALPKNISNKKALN